MSFGTATAIIRPGAAIVATLVGPRGLPGANGLSVTGPAAWTPPAAWRPLQSYVAGPPASFVTIGGSSYVCVIAHTSTTFAADLASGFWVVVSSIGATGQPGSMWYEGAGVPASTTGTTGDYWFQTDTADIFRKTGAGWGQPVANIKGLKGDMGAPGLSVRLSSGPPSNSLGVDGEACVDLVSGRLYGPKASGAWPTTSFSLVGPGGGNVNPFGTFLPGHLVTSQTSDGKVIQDAGGAPGDAAFKNTGTTAGTLMAGDDSRVIGALQAQRALGEIAGLGPMIQAAVRRNIGTLSRGRALALAILN